MVVLISWILHFISFQCKWHETPFRLQYFGTRPRFDLTELSTLTAAAQQAGFRKIGGILSVETFAVQPCVAISFYFFVNLAYSWAVFSTLWIVKVMISLTSRFYSSSYMTPVDNSQDCGYLSFWIKKIATLILVVQHKGPSSRVTHDDIKEPSELLNGFFKAVLADGYQRKFQTRFSLLKRTQTLK